MNSKKTLFAILGGVALTTVVGILLIPYKDAIRRKNFVDKARDYTDNAEESIKDSTANAKSKLKKIGRDAARMVNEGGNTPPKHA